MRKFISHLSTLRRGLLVSAIALVAVATAVSATSIGTSITTIGLTLENGETITNVTDGTVAVTGALSVSGATTLTGALTANGSATLGNAVADNTIVNSRVATGSAAGAALTLDSTYAYTEGVELRYTVTDWTGIGNNTFEGMYLRPQINTANASGNLKGIEVNTVNNGVALGSIHGGYFETQMKAISADTTVGPIYGIESQISQYAPTSGTLTLTEQSNVGAAAGRFQIGLAAGLADYTSLYGVLIQTNDASVASRTLGSGLLIRNYPAEGTQTWTKGIQITAPAVTGLSLEGAMTTGLSIAGASTTDISLQNGEKISNATDGGVILASSTGSIIGGNSNSSNPLLKVAADTLDVANGVRQGVLSLDLNRPATNALTSWDGNGDIAFRIQATNRAVSGASGGTRGMELSARNRASGTESWISGAKFTAENSTDGGTIASSTVGEFYMKNNSVVSTSHYGILIQDDSQGVTVPTNYAALKINTSAYALTRANAIWIDSADASNGFTTGVRFDGTITNAMSFAEADGTNGAKTTGANFSTITAPETADMLIKINVGGTSYWIPAYDAGSVTNE